MTTTDRAAPLDATPASPEREGEARRWLIALVAPRVVAIPWVALASAAGLPAPLRGLHGTVLVLLVVTTTATDLLWRRIPNWATYTAAAWGCSLTLIHAEFVAGSAFVPKSLAAPPPAEAAAGFAAGFGIMFVLYGLFHGGAGDVKLVAALGLLVGPDRIVNALVYGFIVAGVAVAAWLILTVGPGGLLREVGRALGRRPEASPDGPVLQRKLPMAPFLNTGVVLVLFW